MDQLKIAGDVAAGGVALGALMQILPPLASLLTILWIGFQFYHSEPVKAWRKKRKEKNDA